MKKMLFFLTLFVLAISVAAYGPQGVHEPGTGIMQPELYQGLGTGQNDTGRICIDMCGDGICQMIVCMGSGCPCSETPESCPEDCENVTDEMIDAFSARVRTAAHVRQVVRLRQRVMNQSLENITPRFRNIYKNQNRVRLAVHALLAMENLTGGIGRNISQIAREFNNSVRATIRAEERVQKRNALQRFFAGGDNEAAEEIEQKVNQNRQMVEQLKQLREQCECGSEVKALMQEQIQNMEQEQTRLQSLAQGEKASKGLFGWLWK